MKKQIWFLSLELIATSSLLAFSWIAPTSAQPVRRIDIRNVKGNVQFRNSSGQRGWSRIQSTDTPSLLPNQWLRTQSRRSRADLQIPGGPIYLQGSDTTSQFAPTVKCLFRLSRGKIVYLHYRNVQPCETQTKKASIQAPGTALFVIENDRETTVGVLANGSKGPVTVTGLRSGETVELRAGELASVSIDGDVRRLGEFSLRDFYRNNPLALGLGLGSEHEDFVNQQPDDLREIILEVREETVGALREQEKESLLDKELLTPPNLEFPLRTPHVPPIPGRRN